MVSPNLFHQRNAIEKRYLYIQQNKIGKGASELLKHLIAILNQRHFVPKNTKSIVNHLTQDSIIIGNQSFFPGNALAEESMGLACQQFNFLMTQILRGQYKDGNL